MKKTNKLFLTMCVAGSFALLLGSCKKNEEVKEVNVGLPTFEEEVDGRAYIDYANGNKFMWNGNDEIVIYNLAEDGTNPEKAIYAADADAEGRSFTTFAYQSGEQLSAKKDGYFVFYPVAKVSDGPLAEGNYETFTVAPTQTYTIDPSGLTPTVDPTAMALACDLESLDGNFTLKPIFGNLKIKMTGVQTVNKIEVIDNRYNLTGNVTMKLHEVDMETFTLLQNSFIGTDDPDNQIAFYGAWEEYKEVLDYSAQGEGKVMTLNCPEGVELNPQEETLFVIGLRPGALKYGFTLNVYVDGNQEPISYVNNRPEWNYGIKAGFNKNISIALPY